MNKEEVIQQAIQLEAIAEGWIIRNPRNPMKLKLIKGKLSRETKHSAAFDLFYAGTKPVIISDTPIALSSGVFTEFEPGYVAIIKEKGGLGLKGLELKAGVVDADYRKEWMVVCRFPPHMMFSETTGYKMDKDKRTYTVQPGEKIAQVVFVKLPEIEVEVMDGAAFIQKDDERTGGFGSTGLT